MKKIEAIIRKSKFVDVQTALNEAGIEFFSFWEVRGVGKQRQGRNYRGIVYDTGVIERIYISIVCRDQYAEAAVNAILSSAKSGEIGDGKVFISEMLDAYRIRTSEQGGKALYIEEDELLK